MDAIQPGSIVLENGFYYYVTSRYHLRAQLEHIKEGQQWALGDMYSGEYYSSDPDYLFVRAVVDHNGIYYFVPSMFSLEGTMDPSRNVKFIEKLSYYPCALDVKTCKKICPGYLD